MHDGANCVLRNLTVALPVMDAASSGTVSREIGIVYFRGHGSKETVLTRGRDKFQTLNRFLA